MTSRKSRSSYFQTALAGWLCATILVGHARLLPGLRLGRVGMTLVAVALVGWTGWHVNRGFVASDRSGEFQEIRRFDALFRGLPPQSVIVSNDYVIDSMLRYKLLGEEAAGQRDIRGPVPPDPEELRKLHRGRRRRLCVRSTGRAAPLERLQLRRGAPLRVCRATSGFRAGRHCDRHSVVTCHESPAERDGARPSRWRRSLAVPAHTWRCRWRGEY